MQSSRRQVQKKEDKLMNSPRRATQRTKQASNNWYRYINFSVILMTALFNSIIVQALSTINSQVSGYFSVSPTLVSLCALEFMILHPPFMILSNYVNDRKGLKLGVSINVIGAVIGAALRLLIFQGFFFVLLGNAIVAITNVYVLSCPARFSSLWFGSSSRVLVTSILVFANGVSGGIGSFISPIIVQSDLPLQKGQEQVFKLIVIHSIVVSLVTVINLVFFRGNPDSNTQINKPIIKDGKATITYVDSDVSQIKDESLIENSQKQITEDSYAKVLKTCFTDKNYIKSLLSMMLTISILNSLITNIELIIKPFGYKSTDAGTISIITIPAGLLGVLIGSMILRKTKKFKLFIMGEYCLAGLASVMFLGALYFEIAAVFWISIATLSGILPNLMASIVEYSCEFMFPVKQATINGLLIAAGQLASFFVGLAHAAIIQAFKSDALVQSYSKTGSFIVIGTITIFMIICLFLIGCTKQDLKRMRFQASEKQKNQEQRKNRQEYSDRYTEKDSLLSNQ